MWGALTGKRRKSGIYGLVIGTIVSSILLYLSFYVVFLYLIIPIVLLLIFHYTKLWRFSDRAFYGLLAIVIAFFLAIGGLSSSVVNSPHQAVDVLSIASVSTDIHFSYSNNSNGIYFFNLTIPSEHVSNNASVSLIDLFTNKTVSTRNVTMVHSGGNYSNSLSLGNLQKKAYVVLYTFHAYQNNSSATVKAEFLGPVLVPISSVIGYLAGSLIKSYFLITYAFFLAFGFFARAIATSRRRAATGKAEQKPPETGGKIQ